MREFKQVWRVVVRKGWTFEVDKVSTVDIYDGVKRRFFLLLILLFLSSVFILSFSLERRGMEEEERESNRKRGERGEWEKTGK